MRTAILFCGHLRSFRNTYSTFQQLKETLQHFGEVDVFCHTWDIEESVTASWWKEHENSGPPPNNVNTQEVIDLYQPKAYRIDASIQFEEIPVNIKTSIPVSGILSMLYSQYEAFRLMETYRNEQGLQYDLVVKTRYDLEYEISQPFWPAVQRALVESVLLVPNTNPYELTGACADVFAIGPQQLMEEYCRFYERFSEILPLYEAKGYRELVPELCLRTYLDHFPLPFRLLEGIRVIILRSNGNRFRLCSDRYFGNNEPVCFFRVSIENNKGVLPAGSDDLKLNTRVLITKYLIWLDPKISRERLEHYTRFYEGKWIAPGLIKALARQAKETSVFNPSVMKSFFEEAMWNAEYGWFRKFRFAWIMSRHSNQGNFYFRVMKKTITGK